MPAQPPIGSLFREVQYQTPVRTTNKQNQPVVSGWSTRGSFRVGIRSLNGREALIAAQFKSFVGHVVTARFPGFMFDPTGRFVYSDASSGLHILQITHVVNVNQRNRWLECYCTETVEPAQSQ